MPTVPGTGRAATATLTLLLLLCTLGAYGSSSPPADTACTLLNRIAYDAPLAPDSLSGPVLSSVADFISAAAGTTPCSALPTLPLTATSTALALNPTSAFFADMDGALGPVAVASGSLTVSVSLTVPPTAADALAVAVHIDMAFVLASTAAPSPAYPNIDMVGSFSLLLPHIEYSAAGIASLPPLLPWSGSISASSPDAGVYVHDSAAFDGLPALVLFNTYQDPVVLDAVHALAAQLRAPLTDVNVRMTGAAATLADSSLTARGLFIDADSDLFHDAQLRYGERAYGERGLYVFAEAACAGLACDSPLQRLVASNLAATALFPHCSPAVLNNDAVVSSSVASMWIAYNASTGLASVVPLSGTAHTMVSLSCPTNDTVVTLAVSATTTPNALALPDLIVAHDIVAVYATLNAHPPTLRGFLTGIIWPSTGGQPHALPVVNVFTPARACFLPAPTTTTPSLTASVTSLFASLSAAASSSPRTPPRLFDAAIDALFPASGPALDALLASYEARSLPAERSLLDFISWYAAAKVPLLVPPPYAMALNVSFDPSGTTFALSALLTLDDAAITTLPKLTAVLDAALDAAASALNSAISSLAAALENMVPGSTSGLSIPTLDASLAGYMASASATGAISLSTIVSLEPALNVGPVAIDGSLALTLELASLDTGDANTLFPALTLHVGLAAPPSLTASAAPLVPTVSLPLANFASSAAAALGAPRGALSLASPLLAHLDTLVTSPRSTFGPLLSSAAASLASASPWIFHGLDPLPYSPASLSDTLDIATLLTEVLANILPDAPTSSLDLAALLTRTAALTINSDSSTLTTSFGLSLTPEPTLELLLVASSRLQPHLRSNMAPWFPVFGSASLGPMPITANLRLAATLAPSTGATITDLDFAAALNVSRFVVPVTIGMQPALTLDGSFHLSVTHSLGAPNPLAAALTLDLTCSTQSFLGGALAPQTYALHLSTPNLFHNPEILPSPLVFSVTSLTSPAAGAAAVPLDLVPSRALNALISTVFRLGSSLFADGGTLDLELAPLGTSVGALSTPSRMEQLALARMARPGDATDTATILAALPSPALATPPSVFNQTLEISLNNIPALATVCTIAGQLTAPADWPHLLNAALTGPECGAFARVLVFGLDTDDDDADPLSTTISAPSALTIRARLPGLVRSLRIAVVANPLGLADGPFPLATPFEVTVGSTAIVPQFSSFIDLSVLAASVLLRPWTAYYPPTLDAYMFSLDAVFEYEIDPPIAMQTSFATLGNAISLSSPLPGKLAGGAKVAISGGFGAVLGAPPSGSGAALLITNFGSEAEPRPLNEALVVAPNNTATLTLGYNVHAKGGPGGAAPPVYQEALLAITLPPGEYFNATIYAAVAAAASAALPAPEMISAVPYTSLSARLYNASSALSSTTGVVAADSAFQVKLTASPVEDSANSLLYVPISFKVTASTIPALAEGTGVPASQVRMVAQSLALGLTANLTAELLDLTGRVGITSFTTGSTSAFVNLHLGAGPAPGTPAFTPVASLVDAVMDTSKLFGTFALTLDVDAGLDVTHVALQVLTLSFPDLPNLHLRMSVDAGLILSDPELAALSYDWTASWTGGFDALAAYNALTTGSLSACDVMDTLVYASAVVFDSPIANARLPGTDFKLAKLGADSVVAKLDALRLAVCTRSLEEPLTLTVLCSLADMILAELPSQNGAAFTVCAHGAFTDTATISLTLMRRPFAANVTTSARLDLDQLLGASSSLPVGVGASADLVATATVEYQLVVSLNLATAAVSVEPGSSYIRTAAGVDFDGELTLSFGALALRLGEVHIDVTDAALAAVAAPPDAASGFLPRFDLSLTGSASLNALLSINENVVCSLAVAVPDLAAFLDRRASASVVEAGINCGSGVVDAIVDALGELSIQAFFTKDVMALLNAWIDGVGEFLTRVEIFLGKANLDVGFLGPGFADAAVARLRERLMAPVTLRKLVATINDVVTDLRHDRARLLPPFAIPRFVWEQVLAAFCDVLEDLLVSCPSLPPGELTDNLHLPFVLGDAELIAFDELKFRLGARGLAELEIDCNLDLALDWQLAFGLAYSRDRGLRLDFETAPEVASFSAAVVFNPGCSLAGQLAVAGFEMSPQPGSSGLSLELSVAPAFRSATLSLGATLGGPATLGLGGLLNRLIENAELESPGSGALLKLAPHVEWDLALGWSLTASVGDGSSFVAAPPTFELSNGKLCMGSFLTDLVGGVLRQADDVLTPLEPFIGPDGYLVREIKYTDIIFGRRLSALEMAVELCGIYDCSADGVLEAVEKFINIVDIAVRLKSLASANTGGPCDLHMSLQDLEVMLEAATTPFAGDAPPFAHLPSFRHGADLMLAADSNALHPGDLVTIAKSPLPDPEVISAVTDPFVNQEFNELLELMGGSANQPADDSPSGFRLYLLHGSIANNVIKIFFGLDTPIVGYYVAPARFALAPTWSWVVWPVPIVTVDIAIPMSVTVYVGDLAVMSSAVVDAVAQKNVGLIARGVAIKTINDNGSKRWQLQASVGIAGGATVNLLVVKGSAAVGIQLVGKLRFVSINGQPWLTVDELAWMVKAYGVWDALEKELSLELFVTAKIKVFALFGYKTVAKWSHTWSWPLVTAAPLPLPPAASPTGALNMGLLSGANDLAPDLASDMSLEALPKFAVYEALSDSGIQLVTSFKPANHLAGASLLTRAVPINSVETIGTYGPPSGSAFVFDLGFTNKLVSLPSASGMTVRLPLAPYASLLATTSSTSGNVATLSTARTVVLSANRLAAGAASGATFGTCGAVVIDQPLAALIYDVSGLPCATTLEAGAGGRVRLSGSLASFGHPLVMTGSPMELSIALTGAHTLAVSEQSVSGLGALALSYPASLFNLTISGVDTSQESTFTLSDSPPARFTTFNGAPVDTRLVLPAFEAVHGHVAFRGAPAVTNTLHVGVAAAAGEVTKLASSTSSLVLTDGGGNHSVSHVNVHTLALDVTASGGAVFESTVMSPADGARVEVTLAGDASTEMSTTVTGCSGSSQHVVRMQGGGNMTTVLRDVSSFGCTVYVYGSLAADQRDTLVLDDLTAAGPRTHVVINRGGIVLYDPLRAFQPVNVFFEAIERLELDFSTAGASTAYHVEFAAGTLGTSVVIRLPPVPRPAVGPPVNFVQIVANSDPVLVTGTFDLRIGVDVSGSTSPLLQTSAPLSGITAPILVAPANTEPLLPMRVTAAAGVNAPAQRLLLDNGCFSSFGLADAYAADPEPLIQTSVPSAWVCEAARSALPGAPSFDDCSTARCAVNVAPTAQVAFEVSTGDAHDVVVGRSLQTISLTLDTGGGNDRVSWSDAASPSATLTAALGAGADSVCVMNAAGASAVDLGEDGEGDTLLVCYDVDGSLAPPSMVEPGSFAPMSTNPLAASSLAVLRLTAVDTAHVSGRPVQCRGSLDAPLDVSSPVGPPALPAPGSETPLLPISEAGCAYKSVLNMTGLDGVRLWYEGTPEQCVRVVGGGQNGEVTLQMQTASNYAVEFALPSYTAAAFTGVVHGYPERSDGVVTVTIPAGDMHFATALPPEAKIQRFADNTEAGSISFGLFTATLYQPSGLVLNAVGATPVDDIPLTHASGLEVTVTGAPNGAELFVHGADARTSVRFPGAASDGSALQYSGPVVVVTNASVAISGDVTAAETTTFVAVGSQTRMASFPMSHMSAEPALEFWHGCLRPRSGAGARAASSWMLRLVDALPGALTSAQLMNCLPGPLLMSEADVVRLVAGNVSVASMGSGHTVRSLVLDARAMAVAEVEVEPLGGRDNRPGWWSGVRMSTIVEAEGVMMFETNAGYSFALQVVTSPGTATTIRGGSPLFVSGSHVQLNTSSSAAFAGEYAFGEAWPEIAAPKRLRGSVQLTTASGSSLVLASGASIDGAGMPGLDVRGNGEVSTLEARVRFVVDVDEGEAPYAVVNREVTLTADTMRIGARGTDAGPPTVEIVLRDGMLPRKRYVREVVFEDASLNWVVVGPEHALPVRNELPTIRVLGERSGLVLAPSVGAEAAGVLLAPAGRELRLDVAAGAIGTGGGGSDRVDGATMPCFEPATTCTAHAMATWAVAQSACYSSDTVQACQASAAVVVETSAPLHCRSPAAGWMVSVDGRGGQYAGVISGDSTTGAPRLGYDPPSRWPLGYLVVALSYVAWAGLVGSLVVGHFRDPGLWSRFVITAGMRALYAGRTSFVNEPLLVIVESLSRWAGVWLACAPARVAQHADERLSVTALFAVMAFSTVVVGVLAWVFHRGLVRRAGGVLGVQWVDDVVFVLAAALFLYLLPWAASVALVSIRYDGVWSTVVGVVVLVFGFSVNRGVFIARKRVNVVVGAALGVATTLYLTPLCVAMFMGGPSQPGDWGTGSLVALFMVAVLCSAGVESLLWATASAVEHARANHLRDLNMVGFVWEVLNVRNEVGLSLWWAMACVQVGTTCAGLALVHQIGYGKWSADSFGLAGLWLAWIVPAAAMNWLAFVRTIRRNWKQWKMRRLNARMRNGSVAISETVVTRKASGIELDAFTAETEAYAAHFGGGGGVVEHTPEPEVMSATVAPPAAIPAVVPPAAAVAAASSEVAMTPAQVQAMQSCIALVMDLGSQAADADERYEVMMKNTALHFWHRFLSKYCHAYADELQMDESAVEGAAANAAHVRHVDYMSLLPELRRRLPVHGVRAPPAAPPVAPSAAPSATAVASAAAAAGTTDKATRLAPGVPAASTDAPSVMADIAAAAAKARVEKGELHVGSSDDLSYASSSSSSDPEESENAKRLRRLRKLARKKSMRYPDKDRPDVWMAEGQSRRL
ncbi:uncharacterized protein AMSG_01258 [Thecamonas trahens ATCC 50062]|uniref:Uncharacterized protein n=1 Tax=Thecamonas trahens ATCC 50062 TaxID=461836 RepID=A0A0L0DMK9_THETB|nr:hypothetical protein AMSG_01258 [Thecamonas trahens ATCC 50062]KNC53547.1 hypothetical protein AMSG_01258 [Thecamonas trahens ATCC 50062]|eukprot:XP_013761866.1 hypothetical protein AMSG_01258 [Thecamonas trahens ATCC 50062]